MTPEAPAALLPTSNGAITVEGNHFVRDGKPYQILSGAIHYARVPRADWRDRLEKARAMGLNTIETYVFWNLHEPTPGVFDFSGQLDVAAFVRLAQEEGLNVILRPGPYVCAEWEAGGLPAWLFSDPTLKVRTTDPRFLAAAGRYLDRVGQELAPLQASRGGPIVAVQIENEYGSYGHDRAYMRAIQQALVHAGFGSSLFYTSDGADMLANDALPDVLASINFGPGNARDEFSKLNKFRPNGPRMAGEYWDGWFDAWGNKDHVHTDAAQQAKELDWMLAQGYSMNLYMFEGGTSFGFMNGANFQTGHNDRYSPQTTSYDYDAPLDEAGRPTKKFFLFRDVLKKYSVGPLPPLPTPQRFAAIPAFTLDESASLWSNLPLAIHSDNPLPLEELSKAKNGKDQAYGYVLYRTHFAEKRAVNSELKLTELHDYAAVYVNQKQVGVIDHRLGEDSLSLPLDAGRNTLDLLVENTGRVNYGPHLQDGQSGITKSVQLGGEGITGWEIFSLPMISPESIGGFSRKPIDGPAFHRGRFTLATAANTFLDTSELGKGFVWVNGHNLGRTWSIGPQHSLYLPAVWLHAGENEVVVFDYTTLSPQTTLRGITEPSAAAALQPGR
uniref:Beta-galactosidase (Lactase) n=1 Tax=mine drainage metagenome TaxID=410659 RepID=E6PYY0_9ZZZZ